MIEFLCFWLIEMIRCVQDSLPQQTTPITITCYLPASTSSFPIAPFVYISRRTESSFYTRWPDDAKALRVETHVGLVEKGQMRRARLIWWDFQLVMLWWLLYAKWISGLKGRFKDSIAGLSDANLAYVCRSICNYWSKDRLQVTTRAYL